VTMHSESQGVATLAHQQEVAGLTRLGPLLDGKESLTGVAREQLPGLVEDPGRPLPERIAAGTLLAILGDPRTPVIPLTTEVPGGNVAIGLPAHHVPGVVERWRHVGVEAPWIEKEVPEFQVQLEAFRLGTYPVTNSQYREFLLDSGYGPRPTTWYLGAYPWDRANHPVAGLSPADVDAYLAWLSARSGTVFRLPAEAEWEHAAKGFEGYEFPWGDEFDSSRANTRETGVHTTTPVGAFPGGVSPFGLIDMAGNVEEYVSDHYRPYPGGRLIRDDLVEVLGDYRITRGGNYARYGDMVRTRRRHGPYPSPLFGVGLRVAADIIGG
jgi:toxoflavin biosynthesis protein ToxD